MVDYLKCTNCDNPQYDVLKALCFDCQEEFFNGVEPKTEEPDFVLGSEVAELTASGVLCYEDTPRLIRFHSPVWHSVDFDKVQNAEDMFSLLRAVLSDVRFSDSNSYFDDIKHLLSPEF